MSLVKQMLDVGDEVAQRLATLRSDVDGDSRVFVEDIIELREATENLLKAIENCLSQ